MIISRGSENKQVTLYPPASSIIELEQMSWIEETNSQEETVHSFCSIDQSINFRERMMRMYLITLFPIQISKRNLNIYKKYPLMIFWNKVFRKIVQ